MADDNEQTWPRAVTRYETSDGQHYSDEIGAAQWQRAINAAELANRALEAGEDLASAYTLFFAEAYSWKPAAETVAQIAKFAGITRRSQLVIEYWQCRTQAGYRPCRINPDGSIFVHGDAGSWSGSYGSDVALRDLERYIDDTRRRLGRIPEAA